MKTINISEKHRDMRNLKKYIEKKKIDKQNSAIKILKENQNNSA